MQPDEILTDPALEARARELSRELRCMVCQNQSIDDSDAPLARDLRILVRERLKAGDSDARCSISWPRATASSCCSSRASAGDTALLWLAPLIAADRRRHAALLFALRRRRGSAESAAPTEPRADARRSRRALRSLLGERGQ